MVTRGTGSFRFAGLLMVMSVLFLVTGVQAQMDDSGIAKNFRWRNIGPANMSGRISDIEALDDDFSHVLIASASGGVWKSTNAGTTFEPIFDTYGAASIGDVAICQSNPDIIWVGTGEANNRNSVAWGDGVYKSTDGGKTFENMGLKETHQIARILIHPNNPDIVYVGAIGHLWGYSGTRGVFKTTDGGRTWTNTLQPDEKTGCNDLVMDPRNPDVVYASMYQRLRRPYRFDSGGSKGGIFKTTDGGMHWDKLKKGLPKGDSGRIGLAISRSNPDIIMALYEHGDHQRQRVDGKEDKDWDDLTKLGTGVYRSEDAGKSWKLVNRYNNRPFYYSHIHINPNDDQRVYLLTGSFMVSTDGGTTLTRGGRGIHGDFHAMWLDPHNKDRYYIGNDGGSALTHDHGEHFDFFDNFAIGQFYAVGVDMRDPYYVYGGLQDNGSWGGPSNSRDRQGILNDHWFNVGGGDGFHSQVDPTDWRTVYVESQQGSISRVNAETRQRASIRPSRRNIVNYDEVVTEDMLKHQSEAGWGDNNPFRFNWSSPIVLSPHNPRTVFFGGNFLFMSPDRGDSWKIISPDLSTNDAKKIKRETGGITSDVTGAENHCSIITVSESPVTPGVIWVGTDDGNVQITRNGGVNWTNVRGNFSGVPDEIWVSRVEASHFDEGTCYVTFDGHRSDEFSPWVFKTTDYGQTWENISANLPDGHCVYVIKEDLKNKNLLFVGTEFGLFVSIDGGASWERFMNNLPTVAVHDLVIHPRDNDVIIGTHGRSIWICDDISALQQMTPEALESDAYLFDNRPVTRWLSIGRGGSRGSKFFSGENPPRGAFISYYLGQNAGSATLEISDVTGKLKRTIELEGEPGINKYNWNMQFDPPQLTAEEQNLLSQIQETQSRQERNELSSQLSEMLQKRGVRFAGFNRRTGALTGPSAPAGVYRLTLMANGKTMTGTLTIREDPILNK